jgi:hypothetical protein
LSLLASSILFPRAPFPEKKGTTILLILTRQKRKPKKLISREALAGVRRRRLEAGFGRAD